MCKCALIYNLRRYSLLNLQHLRFLLFITSSTPLFQRTLGRSLFARCCHCLMIFSKASFLEVYVLNDHFASLVSIMSRALALISSYLTLSKLVRPQLWPQKPISKAFNLLLFLFVIFHTYEAFLYPPLWGLSFDMFRGAFIPHYLITSFLLDTLLAILSLLISRNYSTCICSKFLLLIHLPLLNCYLSLLRQSIKFFLKIILNPIVCWVFSTCNLHFLQRWFGRPRND